MAKFVVVTGGVMSGIGKGIMSASIGMLLKRHGFKVSMQKLDPYLNVDAGTLSPEEHGECFVTEDGAETDLDIGHYERFLDADLTQSSSLMSGRVLNAVIEKERAGGFLGQTVQVVPHLTGAVEEMVVEAGDGSDVHVVEIGGTVGDFESITYFEALRSLANNKDHQVVFIELVYVPYLNLSNEFKTKPAQNAVRDLQQYGITPDYIMARSTADPGEAALSKLAMFANLEKDRVVAATDCDNVYEVPIMLQKAGVDQELCEILGFDFDKQAQMDDWQAMLDRAEQTQDSKTSFKVGVVAKYLGNGDAYKSVLEALSFSSWSEGKKVEVIWIDACWDDKEIKAAIDQVDGVIVPGGFGTRGLDGMIIAAGHCLEVNKPYLGICLGMQMAVVAAARRAGLSEATSSEIDEDAAVKVIDILPDQDAALLGGTMRLGAYDCDLKNKSLAAETYGAKTVSERHRHRYEFNNDYLGQLESWGLVASGVNPSSGLVEIIESPSCSFFIAGQFHPELKARPTQPQPLFSAFVASL